MDPDIFFVLGIVLSVLSIPAIVSAFSESRAPRVGAIVVLTGVLMIAYAVISRPGAYTFETMPDVFMRVAGMVLN